MMPDLKKVKNFCLLKQEDKGEPQTASADKFLIWACKSKSSREGCFPARRAARKLRQQIISLWGRANQNRAGKFFPCSSRRPQTALADNFSVGGVQIKIEQGSFFPARCAARKSAIADKFPMRACAKKAYAHRKISGVHTRKKPPGILGNGSTSDYLSRSSVLAVDPLS